MLKLSTIAAALTAGSMLAFAAGEASAATLGWSYAEVGVGSCDLANGGCNPVNHPAIYQGRPKDQGFNHDASISLSGPHGSAAAWGGVGPNYLSMPEMHASVQGAPYNAGGYSWNFAFVEGVVGYRWDGPTTIIPLDTFKGTLSFDHLGGFYGFANGSLALLTNAVEDSAVGALWAKDNGTGGFITNCGSPGAGGIASTGVVTTFGVGVSAVAGQQCAGTFTLVQGENFYLWSRLETFVFGNGLVDATHTFSVDFAANADPALVALINQNAIPIGADISFGVPEPSTWAMMLLGFGALGSALRRRRAATLA